MTAAEKPQGAIVERLDTEGNSIDACGRESGEVRRLHGCGVRFQRDLDILAEGPVPGDVLEQGGHGRWRHERRCAPAKEDAVERPARGRTGVVIEFGQQGAAPARLVDLLADMTVEIAIGAFGTAERPVQINTKAAVARSVGHHAGRQASASRRKASARWLI